MKVYSTNGEVYEFELNYGEVYEIEYPERNITICPICGGRDIVIAGLSTYCQVCQEVVIPLGTPQMISNALR